MFSLQILVFISLPGEKGRYFSAGKIAYVTSMHSLDYEARPFPVSLAILCYVNAMFYIDGRIW